MNESRSELLGNYDVKKLLIKLSIPATTGMMVNALYNLVDTLFVGRGVGEVAIGALGLAFPVQMILFAIGLMIGIGGASVFSRAYGRGDRETMKEVVNTALRVDIILTVSLTILGAIFMEPMLRLFGATESNIGYAKDYLGIIFIGLLPKSLSMILNNFARAEGRAKLAMQTMVLGAGLNIILDPIFIFDWGLGLGVSGAAIATVISQFVAFIYIFTRSLSSESELKISLKGWLDIHPTMIKETFLIGLPTFVRNSVGAFVVIIIFNIINFYAVGDPAIYISIYSVINRVIFFIFLPAFGLVQGLAPIAGFNFGAKKPDRLEDVIKYATKIIVVYFILGFLFVQFFSPFVFSLFSKEQNEFFITYGSSSFKIMSIGFIFVGFQIILGSIYQSFGYPVRAFIVALSRQFILFIPLVFVFTYIIGLDGLWITFVVSDVIAGIVCFFGLRYEMGVIHKIQYT